MNNGILIINKPEGITSRDVVNQVCKKLHTRRVGHTGTLDPLATGVLVLGVNEGCKIIELLTSIDKEYIAEVVVGISTDTLDVTGKIEETYNIENIKEEEIKKALKNFEGEYNQEVPKYSAVKINGKRLYQYARDNEAVELPKRKVNIKNIELIDINNNQEYPTFTFKVLVSKGTYIRSLIRDIGEFLGYPCTMKNLIRTKQGDFKIDEAINLDNIDEKTTLKSIEESLPEYERLVVDEETTKRVKNGCILDIKIKNKYILIFSDKNEFLAIYQIYHKDENKIKPYRVFGGQV